MKIYCSTSQPKLSDIIPEIIGEDIWVKVNKKHLQDGFYTGEFYLRFCNRYGDTPEFEGSDDIVYNCIDIYPLVLARHNISTNHHIFSDRVWLRYGLFDRYYDLTTPVEFYTTDDLVTISTDYYEDEE